MNIEIIRIDNEKNKVYRELERTKESLLKYEDEMDRLKGELDNLLKEEEMILEELNLIDKESDKTQKIIKEMLAEFEEIKLQKEELEKEVTDVKIKLNYMENKLANKEEKLESIRMELEDTANLIELKEVELKRIREEIDCLIDERNQTKDEISNYSKLKEEKEKALAELKSQKELLMKDYYFEQESLNEINGKINEESNLINSCDIAEAKYNTQLDNVYSKLKDDYELDYEKALEYKIPLEDLNKAKADSRELKKKIKEIGSVNLASIEDYKRVKERLDFISKQHEDLLLSKKNLLQVISDMENKMEEQFIYNFNKINEAFKEVFSTLFGGGKASIELEDDKDVLTCGIEIKAQPPGKKLQNLSLLSGGEKSLTAVALFFAILKVKPTPFCILDEIDAALDEANINRYTNYLRSFSKDTQFIIITHRKGTMEVADILYGVTMEEEGVSKLVSVKLTDNPGEIAS